MRPSSRSHPGGASVHAVAGSLPCGPFPGCQAHIPLGEQAEMGPRLCLNSLFPQVSRNYIRTSLLTVGVRENKKANFQHFSVLSTLKITSGPCNNLDSRKSISERNILNIKQSNCFQIPSLATEKHIERNSTLSLIEIILLQFQSKIHISLWEESSLHSETLLVSSEPLTPCPLCLFAVIISLKVFCAMGKPQVVVLPSHVAIKRGQNLGI